MKFLIVSVVLVLLVTSFQAFRRPPDQVESMIPFAKPDSVLGEKVPGYPEANDASLTPQSIANNCSHSGCVTIDGGESPVGGLESELSPQEEKGVGELKDPAVELPYLEPSLTTTVDVGELRDPDQHLPQTPDSASGIGQLLDPSTSLNNPVNRPEADGDIGLIRDPEDPSAWQVEEPKEGEGVGELIKVEGV